MYQFPKVVALIAEFDRYFHRLRDEGRTVPTRPWPEEINRGGWCVAGVKWQGLDLKDGPAFLGAVIRELFPALVYNAGYSILEPGAQIAPHVGYTDSVYRLHYALEVPKGDCQLKVGENHYKWFPGEALLFDDTVRHSAWNNTQFQRIVILADLKKGAL